MAEINEIWQAGSMDIRQACGIGLAKRKRNVAKTRLDSQLLAATALDTKQSGMKVAAAGMNVSLMAWIICVSVLKMWAMAILIWTNCWKIIMSSVLLLYNIISSMWRDGVMNINNIGEAAWTELAASWKDSKAGNGLAAKAIEAKVRLWRSSLRRSKALKGRRRHQCKRIGRWAGASGRARKAGTFASGGQQL